MLLIFDLDGTIMDTWEEILITFQKVFSKRNLPLDVNALRMAVGLPLEQVIESLVGYEAPDIVRDIRDTFLSLNPRRIKIFEGMEDVLNIPAKKAILTSKGDLGTYRDLRELGIEHMFDVVVTADTVVNKKPDPEGINIILQRLNEEPSRTFMIGDTEMDILAGKRAGVKTIAVTWGNRDLEHLYNYAPDYVVTSPRELKELLESYAQRWP
ncbi:MAG: HAD-IA family hydrolase [Euryarchaeota archaeon]|nr:HAD-IA family hydrolase [Euryarchaeota archaeon]